jgi:hypothetical protein
MAEEGEIAAQQIITPPRDLYEVYMLSRAELSFTKSFHEVYLKLIFLIDIGKEMLGDDEDSVALRELAEQTLIDVKSYPDSRNVEIDEEGNYNLKTGDEGTGMINVRREDLDVALMELKNQQATRIVPVLRDLDSRIFKTLIDTGVIIVKYPRMQELLAQDMLIKVQQKIAAATEEEVELKEAPTIEDLGDMVDKIPDREKKIKEKESKK